MHIKRIFAAAAIPFALAAPSATYLRADSIGPVEVFNETKHDVSAPVRDYYNQGVVGTAPYARPMLVVPSKQNAVAPEQVDTAVQDNAVRSLPTVPGLNILGLGVGFVGPQGPFNLMYAPPDTNASVEQLRSWKLSISNTRSSIRRLAPRPSVQ